MWKENASYNKNIDENYEDKESLLEQQEAQEDRTRMAWLRHLLPTISFNKFIL